MSEAPKRILIVTTELGMGGAERCVANVACRLDRTKYEVHVVALASPPEPPKDALVQQLKASQIPLTFLHCRTKWQLFSAITQLKRIIQETQPEVLWSFLFHANIVSAIASRGCDLHRLQSLRVIEQGKWRRKLQAWAAGKADRVLCVSEGVRRFAVETLHVAESKLMVIPNGIDLESIEPTTYADPIDRKHRLIAVGRLDPQKDYPTMIRGVSDHIRCQDQWELVILGEGPERDAIESEAFLWDMTEWMQLIGWQADVSSWLRNSEIFLLTSRWEGMPNALIEAMAHGLPVVTTNVEGVAELLPGELASQVATTEEFERGETILEDLIDQPDLRQRLGMANRQQIETNFSLRQMVQSYETMLDDVSSKSAPQR